MKSFALLRTNVGLTTNMKIMVDSNYGLSLNSIDLTLIYPPLDLSGLKLLKITTLMSCLAISIKSFPLI